jgi:hypothetical protein
MVTISQVPTRGCWAHKFAQVRTKKMSKAEIFFIGIGSSI